MPCSENLGHTAKVLHFESYKEIKSCRGVKSPQNSEELQKHSRSRLGGDDHTVCHKKGNWQTSQTGCSAGQVEGCAAAVVLSAAMREE